MLRRVALLNSDTTDNELNALFKFRIKGLKPNGGSKLKILSKKDARPTKTGIKYEQKTL